LTAPQIVESIAALDYFVRKVNLSAILSFDDPVAFVVVVWHEPGVRQVRLLR
jgi:hypothetical protein